MPVRETAGCTRGMRNGSAGCFRRGLACAAAVVMICAVGAALLRLAALVVFSFSSPAWVAVVMLVAVAVLNWPRRADTCYGEAPVRPEDRHGVQRPGPARTWPGPAGRPWYPAHHLPSCRVPR